MPNHQLGSTPAVRRAKRPATAITMPSTTPRACSRGRKAVAMSLHRAVGVLAEPDAHEPRQQPQRALDGLQRGGDEGHRHQDEPGEERPTGGADAADHGQQDDREADEEVEVRRRHAALSGGEEGARHAGHGRRQREHHQLGQRGVHAEGGTGRRTVLHGQQPLTELTAANGRHGQPEQPEHHRQHDQKRLRLTGVDPRGGAARGTLRLELPNILIVHGPMSKFGSRNNHRSRITANAAVPRAR